MKRDFRLPTVVSFTSIGMKLGSTDIQKFEFQKLGENIGNRIYVIDKKRSWGNNLNYGVICELIGPFYRKTYSLGNSMGGFLAVILTAFIKIEVCISFVP